MNSIKIILILHFFVFTMLKCDASQGTLNWKPISSKDVANKANQSESISSPFGEIMNNPAVNSVLGGYSNMLQGSTGATHNSMEELKIQTDFAKQQIDYNKDK